MVMTPGFHCRGHRVQFLVRQVRSSEVHGAARKKKKKKAKPKRKNKQKSEIQVKLERQIKLPLN